MKIGYARVSTLDQNLDLQLQALKKAGCRRIFQEKISGSDVNRPEFRRMLDHIREDDIIVVWKLDRLARSTRDLPELLNSVVRRLVHVPEASGASRAQILERFERGEFKSVHAAHCQRL